MTSPQAPSPGRLPAFHPSRMVLMFERPPGGGLRVSCPHLPGWATVARGPHGLASALEEAWREHAVRAYANGRGEVYDLEVDDPRPVERVPSSHDPFDWRPLPDGRWLSPGGRKYAADTLIVRRVIALRGGNPAATG